METLGEFGVFFTLFLVGLEFSPERLRKVFLYKTSEFQDLIGRDEVINYISAFKSLSTIYLNVV